MHTIPVNEPWIGQDEIEYVQDCLQSGWVSSEGKYISAFENRFASYVGRKFGVAVNNGTNALILALRALELPSGSEVIIPTFTIISCALACIYNQLIPVFIDAEKDTWNMDVAQIESKITKKTKVLMPVHIYGHPVDMDLITSIANSHGLYVIEDFAEAIGSEFGKKKCGSFGNISCASFYANKVITTGEGGMCLTDDEAMAKKLAHLRNLAFLPEKRFVHYDLGFNFRMTNIQAAIGFAQMGNIADRVAKKILIAQKYNYLLKELAIEGHLQLPVERKGTLNTYWMYGVVLQDCDMLAEKAIRFLSNKGVQTRPFFYPLHQQPAFLNMPWFTPCSLPVSEALYQRGFYLPSGLGLSEQNQKRVTDMFHAFFYETRSKRLE